MGVAVILIFSRTPFYPYYVDAPRLVPGLDALTDQILAGIVLMAVGKASYLVAIIDIFVRFFRRTRAEETTAAKIGLPEDAPMSSPNR